MNESMLCSLHSFFDGEIVIVFSPSGHALESMKKAHASLFSRVYCVLN